MKRVIFNLDERESLNLEALLSKYGGKAPAYFKYLLMKAFEKEYGSYNSPSDQRIKTIEPELTNEQLCESNGMSVIKHQGVPYCFYQGTGGELDWKWPVDDIKAGIKIWKKLYK